MKSHKLGLLSIAFIYVSAIMGAGFASGREIWQFFGVFGKLGCIGVILVGALFMMIGYMTSKIAEALNTNDLGKVIVPKGNARFVRLIGYFMAAMLYTVIITMSAAGGALFHQQFGLSRLLGGAVIVFFVTITVVGGFDRISHIFRFAVPVVVFVVLAVSITIIVQNRGRFETAIAFDPSPLAPVWYLAAVLYLSYNILGIIPIVATATLNAKSSKHASGGALLGGFFLGCLALMLMLAMLTDTAFSNGIDLPMLAFSSRISEAANVIYTCAMLFAIYASATSNYYGFTTKLAKGPYKKIKIIVFAWIGFAVGLIGFTRVVAYIFPLMGFVGICIVIMIIVNFTFIMVDKRKMNTKDETKFFKEFEGVSRFDFPDGIFRVTAGYGGEALLIIGSEKTALIDCGMAYRGDALVKNIKDALRDRTLNYIFLSHTHYDHIGALPYVRRGWPKAVTIGAAHAKKVLEKPSALRTIRELSVAAWQQYTGEENPDILQEGMSVDRVGSDNDRISLGEEEIVVLETGGHTDCSLTYILEPRKLMFTSESTGVLETPEHIHVSILKSYSDAMSSLKKCREYGAKQIVSPHYGIIPADFTESYWALFENATEEKRQFLYSLYQENRTEEEMLSAYAEKYWDEHRQKEQPKKAFLLNAQNIIKVFVREFESRK